MASALCKTGGIQTPGDATPFDIFVHCAQWLTGSFACRVTAQMVLGGNLANKLCTNIRSWQHTNLLEFCLRIQGSLLGGSSCVCFQGLHLACMSASAVINLHPGGTRMTCLSGAACKLLHQWSRIGHVSDAADTGTIQQHKEVGCCAIACGCAITYGSCLRQ